MTFCFTANHIEKEATYIDKISYFIDIFQLSNFHFTPKTFLI